jgi:non-heme Fe2+,alpha-ketoglutarate-dependent halogenase
VAGSLTIEQVETFHRDGCVFPITVLEKEEASHFRAKFEQYIEDHRRRSESVPAANAEDWLVFPHLRHGWVYDLVTHPRIAEAVESILGPDVMVWDAKLFPKPARSKSFVSWHQDGTYMPMSPIEHVITVWVALGPSTAANAAMQFMPGSHKQGQLPHMKTFAEENLLSYGQQLDGEAVRGSIVDVELQPGQMSIHHMHVIHGSGANNSDIPRLGISINYLTPDVVDRASTPRPAKLLRGKDEFSHFKTFDRPTS